MKPIIKIILLTYFFIALGAINPLKGVADPQILLEFESAVKQLKDQIQVPVILPTKVFYPIINYAGNPESPASNYEEIKLGSNSPEFFTYLNEDTSRIRYQISLDISEDCQGAGACDFGYLIGEKIASDTPKVPKIFSEIEQQWRNNLPPIRSSESPGVVQLAGGVTGYFVPYTCAAYCSTSQIIWDLNGYRYTIAIEQASKEIVVQMANSAILNK